MLMRVQGVLMMIPSVSVTTVHSLLSYLMLLASSSHHTPLNNNNNQTLIHIIKHEHSSFICSLTLFRTVFNIFTWELRPTEPRTNVDQTSGVVCTTVSGRASTSSSSVIISWHRPGLISHENLLVIHLLHISLTSDYSSTITPAPASLPGENISSGGLVIKVSPRWGNVNVQQIKYSTEKKMFEWENLRSF